MKKINSRAKGASGEREFANLLYDHLGVKLERKLDQCRGGGHDLTLSDTSTPVAQYLDRYAFEIKRHSTATRGKIADWWEQAKRQAIAANKLPLLAHRQDRDDWRIVIPIANTDAHLDAWAEIDVHTFIALCREDIIIGGTSWIPQT